jgi:hypothetical protein
MGMPRLFEEGFAGFAFHGAGGLVDGFAGFRLKVFRIAAGGIGVADDGSGSGSFPVPQGCGSLGRL